MTEALPERPLHPLPECTDYELKNYRRMLEHAIKGISPEHAGIMGALRLKLADVLAEESSRRRIRRAG